MKLTDDSIGAASPSAARHPVGGVALLARIAAACVGLLGALAGSGCATLPPISLAASTYTATDAKHYGRVLAAYSRHAHVRHDWDTAFDAEITLLTPTFRAAYVNKVVSVGQLPPREREALAAEQQRDADRFVEIVVMLQCSRWAWNDLTTTKSIWNLTFVDDEHRSVIAAERVAVDIKDEMLAALFLNEGPFTRAYKVRFATVFPDGTPLFRPGVREVSVRIAGPLGHTEITWPVMPSPR